MKRIAYCRPMNRVAGDCPRVADVNLPVQKRRRRGPSERVKSEPNDVWCLVWSVFLARPQLLKVLSSSLASFFAIITTALLSVPLPCAGSLASRPPHNLLLLVVVFRHRRHQIEPHAVRDIIAMSNETSDC